MLSSHTFSRALELQAHAITTESCGTGDHTESCVYARKAFFLLSYILCLLLPYLVSLSVILDKKNHLGDDFTLVASVTKRRGGGGVMLFLSFCYSAESASIQRLS